MPEEIWRVQAKFGGAFRLTENRPISSFPPLDGLRSIALVPEGNDEGLWTCFHRFGADLAIPNDTGEPLEDPDVYARARDLVHTVVAVIAIGSGRRVWIDGGITVEELRADDDGTHRMLIGPEVELPPDLPLLPFPTDLLGARYDSALLRVMRWWSRAESTDDPVDKLIALNNALDMLVADIKGVPDEVRECRKCHAKVSIKASQKAKTRYFLSGVAGCEDAVVREIQRLRVDLAHGITHLSQADSFRMWEHALTLADVIRAEVGRRLHMPFPEINRGIVMAPEGMIIPMLTKDPAAPTLRDEPNLAVRPVKYPDYFRQPVWVRSGMYDGFEPELPEEDTSAELSPPDSASGEN